ncbi:hypothetical protein DYB32_001004 [Aphanomyces invadans]|uniref:Uncharacterized protein n=1 Tax=Aphanomyces invadans TaxID=157072 RepID=A0A418B850_9STRA|nr:hypothetical protein DYB32_001004 [Aphanomyces invadans]
MHDTAGLAGVRVRKWRKELKHVGPGGHLEVLAWIPEVPTPTPALQTTLHHTVDTGKSSAVVKKAQFNTRKRAAPPDGTSARMTRSLRHNTTNGSELWGQLSSSNSVRPPARKEEKKVGEDGHHQSDAAGVPPSHDTSNNLHDGTNDTPLAPSDATPVPSQLVTGNLHEYSFADDDDDDDDGYISPLSSPDIASASPSPAASPDT